MIKLKQNLPPVNIKSTKDLRKTTENKGFSTEDRSSLRKIHLLVENLRKKHNLTKKELCIFFNTTSLYYSKEEGKRNDTIIGVSIGKLAAISGCCQRTVDKALKDTRFYKIRSGKQEHKTNKITLQRQAFSLFQELSTILVDKAVDYFKAYYQKLRTYIPKGIIYNISYKNKVLKSYKIEEEVERIVCKNLFISKKKFRYFFSKFDFVKAGNKFSKTILELVIEWISKLIKLGIIKTTEHYKKIVTERRHKKIIAEIRDMTFEGDEYQKMREITNCCDMHVHIERAKVFLIENKLFYKNLRNAVYDISIKLGTKFIYKLG